LCSKEKETVPALPNVGRPYIDDVSISGFTRSSIYIHDISSLRVKERKTKEKKDDTQKLNSCHCAINKQTHTVPHRTAFVGKVARKQPRKSDYVTTLGQGQLRHWYICVAEELGRR